MYFILYDRKLAKGIQKIASPAIGKSTRLDQYPLPKLKISWYEGFAHGIFTYI